MGFTIVAVAVGLVLGLISGGRPRYLADKRIAGWPLLVAGLALQASVNRLPDGLGLAALIASYAALLLFGLANLRLVGMPLVLVGLVLNTFTITLNGGMSVRRSAVLAARAAPADKLDHLHVIGKHHLARPSDKLTILSDVIPVRPLREVLSFGDIIMSVGVADVLANLLRPGRESPMEEESPAGRVAGRGQGDGGAPDDRASGEGSGRAAADEPKETEPEQSGAGKGRSGRRRPGEEPDAAREGERSR